VKAQHVAREYITQLYRREVLKSLMMLWKVLLAELGDRCHTSTAFDLKTVERRVEHPIEETRKKLRETSTP
jgi:hypothetical protein